MRPRKGWRTVSVVVEVTCRGKYSDKDFRWAVDRALKSGSLDRKIRESGDATFGSVQIKEMNKVEAARRVTFDDLFAEHHLTPGERSALVLHLASYRSRRTVEALLPKPREVARSSNVHS